jgi:hypothetical protein
MNEKKICIALSIISIITLIIPYKLLVPFITLLLLSFIIYTFIKTRKQFGFSILEKIPHIRIILGMALVGLGCSFGGLILISLKIINN